MEMTRGQNTSSRIITRDLVFASNASLAQMVETVRAYLGVSLDEQRVLPDDEAALKRWREAFFSVGIYVFKDAFRVDEYSGFCLYDDIFPIIYVNNSSAKTRQIFTLFHELAHLLFHTSGIDTIHDAYIPLLAVEEQRVEILCNRFAAEFLLSGHGEALLGCFVPKADIPRCSEDPSLFDHLIGGDLQRLWNGDAK
jgi:Zn-dependent peptidase ImmA (M78 family)